LVFTIEFQESCQPVLSPESQDDSRGYFCLLLVSSKASAGTSTLLMGTKLAAEHRIDVHHASFN